MTDLHRRRRALADNPREEMAREAGRLRAEGLSYQLIADRMGISRSYANDLVVDPDGSRGRARKARYGRPCRECGKMTDGSNGRKKAPELCAACHRSATASTHGSRNRYAKGCRCEKCTRSARDYMRKLRERGGEPPSHGHSGYINYGCRCAVCTRANTEHSYVYGVAYRRRKKLREAA